jgi:prolycopene isomerase
LTNNFDAVVLGSGIGGLNCGALLAHAGMKVLVLEQHSKIGGYAHSFKRKQFTFESGIHSVPMSSDGFIMHLLGILGVQSQVSTIELPSMYRFSTPELSYCMPSRSQDINDFLYQNSDSRGEVNALLDLAGKFYDHICAPVFKFEKEYIPEDTHFMAQFHNRSYYDHITSLVSNKKIQTTLLAQWPYAGISPEKCGALYSFTMFLVHRREGSHFCKGGFTSLANALSSVIIANGGMIQTKKLVSGLIVENNRVSHVQTSDGADYRTSLVVSNISPFHLHNTIIPESNRGKMIRRRLSNLNSSISSVIVYMGMNSRFTALMPDTVNFWYESDNFETIYDKIVANDLSTVNHLIMLRGIDEGDYPTLTLMYFVSPGLSNDWHNFKKTIADSMLKKLEELYPGIQEMIELIEIGSPETFDRYTMNTNGALYGFANVKDLYGEAKLPITTHLPNLFQTGHWGKPGGGIWNVMYNSYTASKIILKENL